MPYGDICRRDDALRAIARLAASQGGVVSRRQLSDTGISAEMTRRRLASGQWQPFHGVIRVSQAPVTDRTRAWAALLLGGPGAVLTGVSGLMWHGIVRGAPSPAVILPSDRHPRATSPGTPASWVRLRDGPVTPGLVLPGGYGVAPVERSAVDALRTLPNAAALDVAGEMARSGIDLVSLVRAWLSRHPRSRGNPSLRRLLAELDAGARSRAERRLHRILRGAGIGGWRANVPVHDADGLIGLVDVAFAAERIAIEVDGRAYHTDAVSFQRDRVRQNRLVRAGWIVLRFTWQDVTDRPAHVAAEISATLAAARRLVRGA